MFAQSQSNIEKVYKTAVGEYTYADHNTARNSHRRVAQQTLLRLLVDYMSMAVTLNRRHKINVNDVANNLLNYCATDSEWNMSDTSALKRLTSLFRVGLTIWRWNNRKLCDRPMCVPYTCDDTLVPNWFLHSFPTSLIAPLRSRLEFCATFGGNTDRNTIDVCFDSDSHRYSLIGDFPIFEHQIVCKFCGDRFSQLRELNEHARRHHPQRQGNPRAQQNDSISYLEEHESEHEVETAHHHNCRLAPQHKYSVGYFRPRESLWGQLLNMGADLSPEMERLLDYPYIATFDTESILARGMCAVKDCENMAFLFRLST